MANSLNQLKSDIDASFTAQLDPAVAKKVGNRFVSAYAGEWAALVAAGTNDNANQRQKFAASKVVDYIKEIFRSESVKANIAAIPPPDVIA